MDWDSPALTPGGVQEWARSAEPLLRRGGDDDGAWVVDRGGPSFRHVLSNLTPSFL